MREFSRGKTSRTNGWLTAKGDVLCPSSSVSRTRTPSALQKLICVMACLKAAVRLIARSSNGNEFSCDSRQRLTTFATLLRFERPWSKLAHGFWSLNRIQSRKEPPIYRAAPLFVTRNVRGSFLDVSKTSCLFALLCYNLSIINRVVNLRFNSDQNETPLLRFFFLQFADLVISTCNK